jgi:hypothetical protein
MALNQRVRNACKRLPSAADACMPKAIANAPR